jgi:hypothetical protein
LPAAPTDFLSGWTTSVVTATPDSQSGLRDSLARPIARCETAISQQRRRTADRAATPTCGSPPSSVCSTLEPLEIGLIPRVYAFDSAAVKTGRHSALGISARTTARRSAADLGRSAQRLANHFSHLRRVRDRGVRFDVNSSGRAVVGAHRALCHSNGGGLA